MPGYYSHIAQSGNVKFTLAKDSPFHGLWDELFFINQKDSNENELRSNSILTQIMTELLLSMPAATNQDIPERITQIQDWLTAHCCDKLNIDQIAAQFYISKFYLCREFKKYTGNTVFQFIDKERIRVAKHLLRFSELSIAAISELVGFVN